MIADETNVTNVVDPLGGSYYLESLTDDIEAAAWQYLDRVEAMGGTVKCIESGFFQQEVADFAYDIANRKETGEKPVIGVNRYVDADETAAAIEVYKIDPNTERRQIENLRRVKATRDASRVAQCLTNLQQTARDESANLMPATIEAVKAKASMGEIVSALREIWGGYTEAPVF